MLELRLQISFALPSYCGCSEKGEKSSGVTKLEIGLSAEEEEKRTSAAVRLAEKVSKKKSERATYLVVVVVSSLGITSITVMAVYYRSVPKWRYNCHSVLSI